jgi:putative hemolysin
MIDNSSLSGAILILFGILFLLTTFVKSSLSTITRESVVAWKSEGRSGSDKLEKLFKMTDQYVSAFTILRTLALAVCLISSVLLFTPGAISVISIGNALIVTLIILFVIGAVEMFIRSATKKKGQAISVTLSPCIFVLATILRPITRLQERIIEISSRSKNQKESDDKTYSNDNITIELGDDGEPLEEHEVRMIKGVFQLDKTVAREIMIPRVDMITAEISFPIETIATLMLQTGHSKIPVYQEELDHIEGIAHSMDILRLISNPANEGPRGLKNCLRPVLYVPESKTLEDLLTEFQENRMQMAIVIDEYGGVSGLVTVEDLVEEIVGELHDEFDTGDQKIRRINEFEYHLDAGTDIDDVSESLGVSFEGEGFDTIGGFVLHQLGKIPSTGDSVQYDLFNIQVISTVGRRLKTIKVTRSEPKKNPE